MWPNTNICYSNNIQILFEYRIIRSPLSQSGDVVWLVDGEQVLEDLEDVEAGQTQSTTLDVGQFSVLPLEEVGEEGYHLKTGLLN